MEERNNTVNGLRRIAAAAAVSFAAFVMLSCVGAPVQKAPPPDEKADYKAKALSLIGGAVPELALEQYNRNLERFPEESAEILRVYAEREKALFDRYKSSGDLMRLQAVYTNLRALGQTDDAMESLMRSMSRKDLKDRSQTATLLAMQYKDPSVDSGVPQSHILPITDYEKISCHVIIHLTYKTVNGITRKDGYMGSGFFIDPHHIVTAYHVVKLVFDDSTISWSVEIKKDGTYHPVDRLLAYDSISDIAILETREAFTVPESIIGLFGDSSSIKPGSEIYCLGDPLGLEQTWSKGIVSAASRHAPEIGEWMQIDAAISPGSSGGLVLGADGRIYGMAVAGIFFGNINFAVPSNTLLERIDGLLAGNNPRTPWIGLHFEGDPEKKGGLVVADIFPSSPLKGTSVRAGDTVLEINGVEVKTVPVAQAIIYALPLGSIVRIKVFAKLVGKVVEYYVQLTGRPEYAMYNATQNYDRIDALYRYFGFELDKNTVNKVTFTYEGETETIPFYKVLSVAPESRLDDFGVKPGDQIGILVDATIDMTRYIALVHLPENTKEIKDISDQILGLTVSATDENIL